MLVPAAFKINDSDEVAAFLRSYSFATVVSGGISGLMAAHVPLLSKDFQKQATLRGHVTASNPLVAAMRESGTALAIFQGPHGYVSSSWYIDKKIPPTWNFTAAHLTGSVRLLESNEDKLAILRETVDTYEQSNNSNWTFGFQDAEILAMLPQIIGFEITVTDSQCCYKLSQNRKQEDRDRVISQLKETGKPEALELATWMVNLSAVKPGQGTST